jgi:putative oxidoreductase
MLRNLGLLLLRLGIGGTMMLHGIPKLFGGPGKSPPPTLARIAGSNYRVFFEESGGSNFAAWLAQMGIPQPRIAGYAAGVAETFGGLGLILGLKTRLSALLIIFDLCVAIWKVHWKVGFFGEGGYEFPFGLANGAASLALTGPGALALDSLACCEKRAGEGDED